MGAMKEVLLPDLGDFKEVDVIEILVKPGDTVSPEQSLITLETDKATMEIPSPSAGVVKQILVNVGDKISQGKPILMLEESGAAAAAAPAPKAEAPKAEAPKAPAPAASKAAAPVQVPPSSEYVVTEKVAQPSRIPPVPTETAPPGSKPHASPSVRKFARELGVDLALVKGSAPKGRILVEDVQAFVKGTLARGPSHGSGIAGLEIAPWPQVDFAKFGPTDVQPLSRIKKLSGANLARNWVMIPHVTNNDEADITELETLRLQLNKENEKVGLRVTMLAFLIKGCVAALKKFPEINSSLDGDNLVLKQYYHIGFAADTQNGLVVPVIKDADKKGVFELAKEAAELARQAREGKLKPADMQGGSFSISSLGGIGGTSFTPIINAPEVAILGVSKATMKPVWNGKEFAPRLMVPLSLSYDHRVIDGADAMRFLRWVVEAIEQPFLLSLVG